MLQRLRINQQTIGNLNKTIQRANNNSSSNSNDNQDTQKTLNVNKEKDREKKLLHIYIYLLTCSAPASGQLNCLQLLCYQRQHEHDVEIREQHSKMDSYANAIPCSGTEVFDVPR